MAGNFVFEPSTCCLQGCTLTGSWNWKCSHDRNPGTLKWDVGIASGSLTAAPNFHASSLTLQFHISFWSCFSKPLNFSFWKAATEREYLSSTGSLPRCPQQPGLGHAKPENQKQSRSPSWVEDIQILKSPPGYASAGTWNCKWSQGSYPGFLPRHSDVESELPQQHLSHPPNTSIFLLEHHSFVVSSGLSTVKPVFHLNSFTWCKFSS